MKLEFGYLGFLQKTGGFLSEHVRQYFVVEARHPEGRTGQTARQVRRHLRQGRLLLPGQHQLLLPGGGQGRHLLCFPSALSDNFVVISTCFVPQVNDVTC